MSHARSALVNTGTQGQATQGGNGNETMIITALGAIDAARDDSIKPSYEAPKPKQSVLARARILRTYSLPFDCWNTSSVMPGRQILTALRSSRNTPFHLTSRALPLWRLHTPGPNSQRRLIYLCHPAFSSGQLLRAEAGPTRGPPSRHSATEGHCLGRAGRCRWGLPATSASET